MLPVMGTCVSLSWQIMQLLWTSKDNKHEHKSLQSALTNIHRFLQAVPADGVSSEGREVLGECGGANCGCSTQSLSDRNRQLLAVAVAA